MNTRAQLIKEESIKFADYFISEFNKAIKIAVKADHSLISDTALERVPTEVWHQANIHLIYGMPCQTVIDGFIIEDNLLHHIFCVVEGFSTTVAFQEKSLALQCQGNYIQPRLYKTGFFAKNQLEEDEDLDFICVSFFMPSWVVRHDIDVKVVFNYLLKMQATIASGNKLSKR